MGSLTKGEVMLNKAGEIGQFWAYELGNIDKSDLTLIDNVQFIYELSLAQLELKSLGADFEITNGLREFKLINKSDELIYRLKTKVAYFKSVCGKITNYFKIIQKNKTRSVNQYLTHWIYPYKGKFHPQMIRALLNIIGTKEGDTVLDPFSGSGTTGLEAQLLGINFIGIDVSPICVLQGMVKTQAIYVIDEIKRLKNIFIANNAQSPLNQAHDFYKLLESIEDERIRNFFIIARLLAISDKSRRGRNFEQSFIKNLNLMIDSVEDFRDIVKDLGIKLGNTDFVIGDSRELNIPDNSIDGIVTSPPYSIALDYVENDAHSFRDLGISLDEIREQLIGVRGKGYKRVELYNEDMMKSYNEMYRVLKPDKFAVIIIGNATYQSQEIKTVEFTIDYMQRIGFRLEKNILKIIFGLYNVMKKENILIFKKTQ